MTYSEVHTHSKLFYRSSFADRDLSEQYTSGKHSTKEEPIELYRLSLHLHHSSYLRRTPNRTSDHVPKNLINTAIKIPWRIKSMPLTKRRKIWNKIIVHDKTVTPTPIAGTFLYKKCPVYTLHKS